MLVFLSQLNLSMLFITMLFDYLLPRLKSSLAPQTFRIRVKFLLTASQDLRAPSLSLYPAWFQNPPSLSYSLLSCLRALFPHPKPWLRQPARATPTHPAILTVSNHLLILQNSAQGQGPLKCLPQHIYTLILTFSQLLMGLFDKNIMQNCLSLTGSSNQTQRQTISFLFWHFSHS